MSILKTVKNTNTDKIQCGGKFTVTLGVTAIADIGKEPVDIVLILDKSGSMGSSGKLQEMKKGAKEQIDIISGATGGIYGKTMGTGSHMGIVSFSTNAVVEQPLISDAEILKNSVDALKDEGITNHADGFRKARDLFDPQSTNKKIIVMFTDGQISDGDHPDPVAKEIRDSGIIIYAIGVEGSKAVLSRWATDPDDTHVAWTDDPQKTSQLFVDISKNMTLPGAENIRIKESVNPMFEITTISAPTKGTITKEDAQTFSWKIDVLGNPSLEEAAVVFEVQHIGRTGGSINVNQSLEYTDDTGNVVSFPDPVIKVECGNMPIIVEPCPMPVSFQINGCQDAAVIDLRNVELSSLGRIVQLDTTIKNICPGKRVAVAVQLTEIGKDGEEYPRGLKTFTVPAHTAQSCADIEMKCIRFILPEDLDVSGGSPNSICNARNFRVRAMANYIDTDFVCCDTQIILP